VTVRVPPRDSWSDGRSDWSGASGASGPVGDALTGATS